MKIKNFVASLGIISMLGLGLTSIVSYASDSGKVDNKNSSIVKNDTYYYNEYCRLTDEEQKLVDKGYNELTQNEKNIFNKYYGQEKYDLSEQELNEYYKIHDKVYKYLGESYNSQSKGRQANRQFRGQGMYRGMCN